MRYLVVIAVILSAVLFQSPPVQAKGEEIHSNSDTCTERLANADVIYVKRLFYNTDPDGKVYVRDPSGKGISLKGYIKWYLPASARVLCIDRRNHYMEGYFYIYFTLE